MSQIEGTIEETRERVGRSGEDVREGKTERERAEASGMEGEDLSVEIMLIM